MHCGKKKFVFHVDFRNVQPDTIVTEMFSWKDTCIHIHKYLSTVSIKLSNNSNPADSLFIFSVPNFYGKMLEFANEFVCHTYKL